MKVLDFGKNKGKTLSECDEQYLKWLVSHEKVLAKRNRWASRDAKFILDRQAQVQAHAEAVERFESEREARLAVKAASLVISTPVKVDLGLKGNLNTSRAFSIWR